MRNLPVVKISTKNGHTDTFIDDYRAHHITGIFAKWDNTGMYAKITITMLADVEVDAESELVLKSNKEVN